MTNTSLNLHTFYPSELMITQVTESTDCITIQMHSSTKSACCHQCGTISNKLHGTHHRKAQDLPILGKRVILDMQIYDYVCSCDECELDSFTETFDNFLSYNSRMTERLDMFLCTLALETSCEAAARIMKTLNVKISGDTIIRLLEKRYSHQSEPVCGCTVGIDDFAFKKRHSYGTIVVDHASHNVVAVLDGRDGQSLKEWLKKNKQITTVTRDRASAYSKAVEEVLPGCMQIADRFHIHQNLMEAVNKVLGREIPQTMIVPNETELKSTVSENDNNIKNNVQLPSTEDRINKDGKKNDTDCG